MSSSRSAWWLFALFILTLLARPHQWTFSFSAAGWGDQRLNTKLIEICEECAHLRFAWKSFIVVMILAVIMSMKVRFAKHKHRLVAAGARQSACHGEWWADEEDAPVVSAKEDARARRQKWKSLRAFVNKTPSLEPGSLRQKLLYGSILSHGWEWKRLKSGQVRTSRTFQVTNSLSHTDPPRVGN